MKHNKNQNTATIKLECKQFKITDLTTILINIEKGIKNETYGDSEIYIKEVRKGSMIFEIVQNIIATSLPFIENCNSIATFIQTLTKLKEKISSPN